MLSPIAAEHVQNPRNRGPLEVFTHFGQVGVPGDGPFVQIWLNVEAGVIKQAAYATHGCPWSVACASVLCQLVTGRAVEKAALIDAHDIEVLLGGLPEGKGELAATTAAAALSALLHEPKKIGDGALQVS